MKNRFTVFVGALIVGILVVYMLCFQVRYDQAAVLTTFEKASAASIKTQPRLYFRLPWPIQSLYIYDTRLRVLEDNLEQFQTADGYSIIVRLYTAWRISDPLAFYSNPKTPEVAEDRLRPLVQDLRKVVSKYRFDQLVNTDPGKLAMEQIEGEMIATLQAQLDAQRYGVKAQHVGLRRIVLPEASTQQVFDRMKKTREALAANIEQDGKAEATRITSEAQSMRDRILTFADRRAKAIRTLGDEEAVKYYEAFKSDEQFAVFLQRIKALPEILKQNTTFVIDVNQLSEFNLFSGATAGERPAGGKP